MPAEAVHDGTILARSGRDRGPSAALLPPAGSHDYPDFVPRWPWIGADLQTLRDSLVPSVARHRPAHADVLTFPMPDATGDRLTGVLESPHRPEPGRPLAVLVHGLTGCADSLYVRRAAGQLLDAGFRVLRLNLRGAGTSRPLCREQYHSGRSEDLRAVLGQLPADALAGGVALVGWSLGGNLVLKALGEFGQECRIRAAVAVSAPIDLAAAAVRIGERRNRVYHRWLLNRMIREAAEAPVPLSAADRAAMAGIRGIVDFDDRFTAPRNGFAGVADYYARCSAIRFMPAIAVPTLVIHALDDPWIPGRSYSAFDWAANPNLIPLLPRHGGHVGFHATGGRVWSDDCMVAFLEGAALEGAALEGAALEGAAARGQPAARRLATSTAK